MRHGDFKRWIGAYGPLSRPEWLLLECQAVGISLDDSVNWLSPTKLGKPQIAALLRLLVKGSRPLRMHADRVLLRLSGLPLQSLNAGASETEAKERAQVYEGWVRRTHQR